MIKKTALALICILLVQIDMATAADSASVNPLPFDTPSSPSVAQVTTPAQQIAVLDNFFQKKLVGIESLTGVIPSSWLREGFSAKKERRLAEENLTQLLSEQAGDSLSVVRRAELKESGCDL